MPRSTVHPHARGDYALMSMVNLFPTGSPPRTWGLRVGLHSRGGSRRFTPTHVGTTPPPLELGVNAAVHPHARGDYWDATSECCDLRGSPPRTWGLPKTADGVQVGRRFTPTHVGTTPPRWSARASEPVHPHARGDYAHILQKFVGNTGSPPRTWGLPLQTQVRPHPSRFTPTHVGTTI